MNNEGRVFLAELAKKILNENMVLENLYLPENIFDWVRAGLKKEADEYTDKDLKENLLNAEVSGKSFVALGLKVYKHYGPNVFSFSRRNFIEIVVDEQTRKILSYKYISPEIETLKTGPTK